MTKEDKRKATVTDEHKVECAALLSIWNTNKCNYTQAEFGQEFEIGSQAAVGFFLNGKSALSLNAAYGFAKGLGCKISDFSPRLAKIARDVGALADHGGPINAAWPFEGIDPIKLSKLGAKDLLRIEGAMFVAAGSLGLDVVKTTRHPERKAA